MSEEMQGCPIILCGFRRLVRIRNKLILCEFSRDGCL